MKKELLKKYMYKDACEVYRSKKVKVGKSDDYTREYELIYENLPCKLAQYHERSTFHRDDISQKDTLNYMLYYAPEFSIQENDVISIRGTRYFAGSEFEYCTHKELQLKRRKEAVQK